MMKLGQVFLSFVFLLIFPFLNIHPHFLEKIVCQIVKGSKLVCYDESKTISLHPLHLLTIFAKEGAVITLSDWYFQYGLSVDGLTDSNNATALSYAAFYGECWVVHILLQKGANPNHRDLNGKTPLDLVKESGKKNVIFCIRLLEQYQHMKLPNQQIDDNNNIRPKYVQVDRIPFEKLSLVDFKTKYANPRIPVVIENVFSAFNLSNWTITNISDACGLSLFSLSRFDEYETTWGKLIENNENFRTLSELITLKNLFSTNRTKNHFSPREERIFDHSFTTRCANITNVMTIPKHFVIDFEKSFYQTVTPLQPSLFVDPAGVRSGLRISQYGASYWMFIFEGEKQFRIVNKTFEHFLRSDLFEDQRYLSFIADLFEPDFDFYPNMRFIEGWETVVKTGDLLFIPFDLPHQDETPKDTIAFANSFVDFSTALDTFRYCCFSSNAPRATDCAYSLNPLVSQQREFDILEEKYRERLRMKVLEEYNISTEHLPLNIFLKQFEIAKEVVGIEFIPFDERETLKKLPFDAYLNCQQLGMIEVNNDGDIE